MTFRADYHVHSNYSDGRPMPEMLAAAAEAGLDAVGFADHCNVLTGDSAVAGRKAYGHNFDLTHERRRDVLADLGEHFGLTVYDAVEMDYVPADEAAVGAFLDGVDFDYVYGSVHALDGTVIFDGEHFAGKPESERAALVDRYYERQVAAVESGLFDVLAHPDAVERTPSLRGFTTPDHHAMLADALAEAGVATEVNAGRALRAYGEFHPEPGFLAALRERGVPFVPGSDSHRPGEVGERNDALRDHFDDTDLEPAVPPGLDRPPGRVGR